MHKYQDLIVKLREKDSLEFVQLKEILKGLKEHTEDMDYELIRLAKAQDRKRRALRKEEEDIDVNIDRMRNWEIDKKLAIEKVNKEITKVQDANDVQIKKLEEDLAFFELEMKKSRFVFENYEREVERWRKEVEGGQQNNNSNFLQVPGVSKRRSRSNSSLSNRSRQR